MTSALGAWYVTERGILGSRMVRYPPKRAWKTRLRSTHANTILE